MLPFKTVANQFHYLDRQTCTLYIPIEDGAMLCRKIHNGTADRQIYRLAGQYCINVYEQDYQELLLSEDIQPVGTSVGVLTNPGLYDPRKGLIMKTAAGNERFP